MLSVNQMNAQIKISEAWKVNQDEGHPLKLQKVVNAPNSVTTRAISKGELIETGKTDLLQSTYLNETSKAWNKTPSEIKSCNSIWAAKKEIKKFVKELPISSMT